MLIKLPPDSFLIVNYVVIVGDLWSVHVRTIHDKIGWWRSTRAAWKQLRVFGLTGSNV